MIIEKRDGTLEQFNLSKIKNAIRNVLKEEDTEKALEAIKDSLPGTENTKGTENPIKVEDIQDIVEKSLMSLGFFDEAKSYILYRKQRENIRNSKTSLTKTFKEVLNADGSDVSRENANVDGKAPMGLMLLFGSEIEKDFVKRYMISPKFTELHDSGDIHIHDLNMYACTFNCCNIGLKELFRKGFSTGHGTLRPPQSISTALTQAAIVIQANQNDMYGGQGIPLFDYELSPFIAKTLGSNIKNIIESILGQEIDFNFRDFCFGLCEENKSALAEPSLKKLDAKVYEFVGDKTQKVLELARSRTFKDTFQACEGFVHNLNSLNSRAGSQVPFSSINYGTNTTPEGQMIIEGTLDATEEGLGNGETSIFPVQIFKIKEGVNANPGDPNYYLLEKAVEVSSKRLYPNFVNIDVPGNIEYYEEGKPETEMATMGALSSSSSVVLYNFSVPSNDVNFATKLYFDEVEDYLVKNKLVGDPIQFDENTVYYNTNDVYIFDSDTGRLVRIKKFMIFKTTQQWYRVHCVLRNKRCNMDWSFDATEDHPLPVIGKGRTLVSDLKEGDFISASLGTEWGSVTVIKKEKLDIQKTGYDFETESDKFDTDYIVSHNCRTKTLAMPDGTGRTTNRGNIAFTTINLPRLGILAEHSVDKFFELLDQRITDCIDELLERVNYIKTKKVYNFPFLMGQNIYLGAENLGWNDSIEKALRNGTLAVGFIGIAEALKALIGKHHGESEEAYQLALKIVRRIRERTDKATSETGWMFGCFATPAEGLAGRFAKMDQKKFGVIEGVTDRKFYTNSFHIPVYFPITATKKMQKEGPFHALCNAGAITYVEMDGDPSKNLKAVMKLVQFSRKCGISYFSINHSVDRCPVCGYEGIIETDVCPHCGWKEGEEISLEELEKRGIDTKKLR